MTQIVMKPVVFWVFLGTLLLSGRAEAADVFAMAADSMVAAHPSNPANEAHGMGEMIGDCFQSGKVTIKNFAVGGETAKSFYKGSKWPSVTHSSSKWILIEFGQNDQSHASDGKGSSPKEFGQYLQLYATESAKAGALPIFVTAPPRNNSNASPELKAYADAMKQVAKANGAPLVDLYTLWGNKIKAMSSSQRGQYYAKTYHSDFSLKGAQEATKIVCAEAIRLVPSLAKIKK